TGQMKIRDTQKTLSLGTRSETTFRARSRLSYSIGQSFLLGPVHYLLPSATGIHRAPSLTALGPPLCRHLQREPPVSCDAYLDRSWLVWPSLTRLSWLEYQIRRRGCCFWTEAISFLSVLECGIDRTEQVLLVSGLVQKRC